MKIFDYSKLNEYKWDSEVISLIAQIHEHKGKQSLYLKQKPQTLEQLIEIAKIQSTESFPLYLHDSHGKHFKLYIYTF